MKIVKLYLNVKLLSIFSKPLREYVYRIALRTTNVHARNAILFKAYSAFGTVHEICGSTHFLEQFSIGDFMKSTDGSRPAILYIN